MSRDPAIVVPLFRTEVLQQAGARKYGTVLLARPVSFAWLSIGFGAVMVAIVAFLACADVTRKAQVSGVLQPSKGLIRVMPTQAGVVSECRVSEGQSVRAGQVLCVVNSEHASATRGDAGLTISGLLQSRRDSLLAEQEQQRSQVMLRIAGAQLRAEQLADEGRRVDEQIALQQRRVSLADEAMLRYADLQASNFVSRAQVQDRQTDQLDQRQRLADLQRGRAALARDASTAMAEVRDLRLQTQRDRQTASRTLASLDQELVENEVRREIEVRAPQDGTVTAITAQRGQGVSGNQALASILPAGSELEAELYLPSRSAGFVKAGMEVLLRYQAFPFQKFGQFRGVVREVSGTSLRPDDIGEPRAVGSAAEPLYRVRVALERQTVRAYGAEQLLRSGMALDASVLLDRRRLYEWVLEPLFAISGRS
jgi:membrane fusion protein